MSRPIDGAVKPSTVRANTSPISANSTRLRLSQAMFAPRSSITTSPRAEGKIAAIAGRSIPGSVFSTILASVISAPVLPALTTPAASPAATASIASRMDAARTRRAAVGFMSPAIDSAVCRMVQAVRARLCRASSGRSRASSPTSRNRAAGWRSAAVDSPATTTSGARSPPMASIARV